MTPHVPADAVQHGTRDWKSSAPSPEIGLGNERFKGSPHSVSPLTPTVAGPLEPTDGVKAVLSSEATTVHAFPVNDGQPDDTGMHVVWRTGFHLSRQALSSSMAPERTVRSHSLVARAHRRRRPISANTMRGIGW